jgi:hypothetical protein
LARVLTTPATRGITRGTATGTAPPAAAVRAGAPVRRGGILPEVWRGGILPREPGARSRRWIVLLAAGWLIQVGLRVWFSRHQSMPLANPDETAYLLAARVLAGGPGGDLSFSTLYQGGYPLLITPAFWFASDPGTVYHIVLVINALVSALILPLGYLTCRRLGLGRPLAYGVATAAALLPAGFFYSEYAMTDAIFPVLTLAWLLATHTWLTAVSARGRCAAAATSALLAAYAYSTHARGMVMLAGLAVVGAFVAWRRPGARFSVLVAGLTGLVAAAAGWALNHHLTVTIYPEGTRSFSSAVRTRLDSVHGVIHVLEMAAGQLWRLVMDSWGIAGIGLVAALAVILRRDVRPELRLMAALSVGVTTAIGCLTPAALPLDQGEAWASGRYLDGMIIVFFLAGSVMLLRARMRLILACAAVSAGLFLLAAVTVSVYIGTAVPTSGFGSAFNFAEPAVLTWNWTQANVPLATAVTLVMLAVWLGFAAALRRWRDDGMASGVSGVPGIFGAFASLSARGVIRVQLVFWALVAAVSLVAVSQMTSQVSQAGTLNAQAASAILRASDLKPGEHVAVDLNLSWQLWIPQSFEISWTALEFFKSASQPPPAGVSVVELAWPNGQPAQASWPDAPPGWRVIGSDRGYDWVVWREG